MLLILIMEYMLCFIKSILVAVFQQSKFSVVLWFDTTQYIWDEFNTSIAHQI